MNWKLTLLPLRVTLLSTDHTAWRSVAGYFFMSLKVKRTSAAVSGLPSDHFTPDRIVTVSFVSWFAQAYFLASHGVALPLFSASTKTSDS